MAIGLDIGKLELALSVNELKDLEKTYNTALEGKFPLEDIGGTTWLLEGGGGCVHIVYVNLGEFYETKIKKNQEEQLLSTVLHEGVHVSQHYFDYIGETAPGKEIEAYLIENIFKELKKMFRARVQEWKKEKPKQIH